MGFFPATFLYSCTCIYMQMHMTNWCTHKLHIYSWYTLVHCTWHMYIQKSVHWTLCNTHFSEGTCVMYCSVCNAHTTPFPSQCTFHIAITFQLVIWCTMCAAQYTFRSVYSILNRKVCLHWWAPAHHPYISPTQCWSMLAPSASSL